MKAQKRKASPPIAVILIAGYFFLLAIWNFLRMGEAIFFWTKLGKYDAHPMYLSISGGLWAGGCIALVVGLWKGQIWTWVASLIGVIVHYVWFWADRLFIQGRTQNWPFVLTTSTILFIMIIFLLTHKRTYGYFLKVTGI